MYEAVEDTLMVDEIPDKMVCLDDCFILGDDWGFEGDAAGGGVVGCEGGDGGEESGSVKRLRRAYGVARQGTES